MSIFLVILTLTLLLVSPQAWLNKRPEAEAEVLKGLFDKSFDEIMRFARENCVFKMDILEHNYIMQVGTCTLEYVVSYLQYSLSNPEGISKVLITWTGGRCSRTKVPVCPFLYTTVTSMAFAMSVLSV